MWRDGKPSSAPLPPALAKCYEPIGSFASSCQRTMDFGFKGWQMVMTTGKAPTKLSPCVEYGCLLFDPKTRAFASPEDPTRWGGAETVVNSSCRTFYFDEAGRHYVTKSKICDFDKGCADLGGTSIGWLPSGPRIEAGF